MTQDTNTNTRPGGVAAPGIARIIGRNVTDLAAILRGIEPEELGRVELLQLLGVIAASCELSGSLLDSLADRMNAEARRAAATDLDQLIAAESAIAAEAAADEFDAAARILGYIR